jgi:hypothetical protein
MTDRTILERSIDIRADAATVAAAISDLHRWVDWSPFEGLDPQLKRTYSGPASGVGSSYAWEGNRKAGAGTMAVTAVSETSIDVDVNFLKPFKSESLSKFDLAPTATGTRISWQMSFDKTFTSRIMGLFFPYEKTLGPELVKGLAQLKALLEK